MFDGMSGWRCPTTRRRGRLECLLGAPTETPGRNSVTSPAGTLWRVSAVVDGEVPELRAASYATATQPSPGLHSVRTVDHKFIFDLDADTAQLFDVLDDPTERRNHGDSADWEKVVSQLRYQVTTHIGDSLVNGTRTSETTEISDEMLERLRSLGYVR